MILLPRDEAGTLAVHEGEVALDSRRWPGTQPALASCPISVPQRTHRQACSPQRRQDGWLLDEDQAGSPTATAKGPCYRHSEAPEIFLLQSQLSSDPEVPCWACVKKHPRPAEMEGDLVCGPQADRQRLLCEARSWPAQPLCCNRKKCALQRGELSSTGETQHPDRMKRDHHGNRAAVNTHVSLH